MFGILRKKLKESVKHLAQMAKDKEPEPSQKPDEAEPVPEPEEAKPVERPEKTEKVKGAEEREEDRKPRLKGLVKRFREKEFSGDEIDGFFTEMEPGLLQANLALEVMALVGRPSDAKPINRFLDPSMPYQLRNSGTFDSSWM